MERITRIEWDTAFNEEGTEEILKTIISIKKDEFGNIWIEFDLDRSHRFKRLLTSQECKEMSRFLYDTSDFVKVTS